MIQAFELKGTGAAEDRRPDSTKGSTFSDPTNPAYYRDGGIETIDFIEAKGLDRNFYLANCIKYIARSGKKNGEDVLTGLKKARWYLDRCIRRMERDAST